MTFSDFAHEHGLRIQSTPIPIRTGPKDDWHAGAFHWHILLTNAAGAVLYSGEYSAGADHAELWARAGFPLPGRHEHTGRPRTDAIAQQAWRGMTQKPAPFGRSMTLHNAQLFETVRKRFAIKGPDVESVLESLQGDMRDADSPFEDWADCFGYESDSRKAESIWAACRRVRDTFRAAVGPAALESFLDIDAA